VPFCLSIYVPSSSFHAKKVGLSCLRPAALLGLLFFRKGPYKVPFFLYKVFECDSSTARFVQIRFVLQIFFRFDYFLLCGTTHFIQRHSTKWKIKIVTKEREKECVSISPTFLPNFFVQTR